MRRVVPHFDFREYSIFHLRDRMQVAIDNRRETVYSDARLEEHGAILKGTSEGLAALERWSPEYVWLPATSTVTRAWLVSRGYRIELETARSFVAVRADLPVLPNPSTPSSHGAGEWP